MHAVLITAYKDFESLSRLVTRLDRDFPKSRDQGAVQLGAARILQAEGRGDEALRFLQRGPVDRAHARASSDGQTVKADGLGLEGCVHYCE